jgi:hypothetical protein
LKRALVIVGVLGAVVAASAALPTLRGIGGGGDVR